MPEVRNAMSQAVADLYYLRLDATNDPMQGNLDMDQYEINEIGLVEGGALVADDLTLRAHTAAIVDPNVDGFLIIDRSFIRFQNYAGISTSPILALMQWDETIDLSTKPTIIPQGFWWQPVFEYNTAQSFGGAAVFQDGSHWEQTAFIADAHSSFTIGSFLGGIKYDVGGVFAGRAPEVVYGFSAEPGADAKTGTLTMAQVNCNQTNPPFGLRAFLSLQQFRNGVVVTEYCHYKATDDVANALVLHGGSVLTTQYGLKLESIAQGTTNYSLWSNSTTAEMYHASDIKIVTDNKGYFLGTGTDVSLIYDGTDLILTTDLQNPSDFIIDCGTQKTIELAETVWEDARIPIGAMILGSSPPGVGTFFGSVSVLLFDPSADEEVYLTIQLPHGYKEGTDIVAHVHWAPTSTSTNDVVWGLEYQWQNIGQAFTGASTTITVTDAGNGVTGEHQVASWSAISGTGKTISSMLVCRLYRDVDPVDNFPNDAALLEFDIHFEVDTMGSRQEFTK